MDDIDRKIIQILRENARIPVKSLSEQLNLSSPAVSARLDRLTRRGIIRKYTVFLDPVQMGQHITAYIHLDLQPEVRDRFLEFAADCSNVMECNFVTGRFSILLKCAFPSMEKLDGFVGEVGQYGRTEIQIVFSSPIEWRGLPL